MANTFGMGVVAVLDPAGNSGGSEGSGTTGVAVFTNGTLTYFGDISSKNYDCTESYWQDVWHSVQNADTIVCESFNLFAHKAKQQTGSAMETPQLIGYLRMMAWHSDIKFVFQRPVDKARFADPVLVSMGVFELKGNKHYCQGKPTNLHQRDAIRHGFFYLKYGKGK